MLRSFRSRFTSSRLFRGVFKLAGGTAFGQAITILVAPVLTRMYAPESFGILAVYASALSVLSVVGALRYELAIPLPKDDIDGARVLVASCTVSLVIATALCIGELAGIDKLLRDTKIHDLAPYSVLLVVGFLGASLYRTFNLWAVRLRAYGVIARTRIAQALGMCGIQLLFGWLGGGTVGLILGHLSGQVLGFVALIRLFVVHPAARELELRSIDLKTVAYRYRQFPMFSAPAGLMNTLGSDLPAILLATSYEPKVAGYFFLAQRMLGVPLALIGRSVSQVFQGESAAILHSQPHRIRLMFFSISLRLLVIVLFPATLLFFYGEVLFSLVFGEQWSEAGKYASILSLMFLVRFVVYPVAIVVNVIEKQRCLLVIQALVLLGSTCSILIASTLNQPPTTTIAAYSATMGLVYAVIFCIVTSVLKDWERNVNSGRSDPPTGEKLKTNRSHVQ